MIKNILYVGNSIPNYLQNDNFNVILYKMDLTESPEVLLSKYRKFFSNLKNIKKIVITEGEYAFYVIQNAGSLRLLINPIIPSDIDNIISEDKKVLFENYLDFVYGGQNAFEHFGLFTDINDINIVNFKNLFWNEHCFIQENYNIEDIINSMELLAKKVDVSQFMD